MRWCVCGQSFGYGDAATNAEALRQMAAHLRPGGRLVLDIYNRDFFEARQGGRETTQRGETVVTQRLAGDRLVVDLVYTGRGERDRFDWQVFTPATIEALAEQCGLRQMLVCTGLDENLPPPPDQPRMQIVFKR